MRTPLWLRHFITFLPILFAHKPICASFKKDLFYLKGIYICRSCSFLLAGFILGILSIIFLDLAGYRLYIASSVFISGIVFISSHPHIYETLSRTIKDWLRFFLGWTLANLLFLLIFKKVFLFLVVAVFLLALKAAYSKLRGKMKDRACDNCEEFYQDKLCSGFLPKAKLMKKYEDQVCRALSEKGRGDRLKYGLNHHNILVDNQ